MSEAPQPAAPAQQQRPMRVAVIGGAAGSVIGGLVLALVLGLAKVLGKLSLFEILAYVAIPACAIGLLVSFLLLDRIQTEYTEKVALLLAERIDEHEARLAALEEKAGLKA